MLSDSVVWFSEKIMLRKGVCVCVCVRVCVLRHLKSCAVCTRDLKCSMDSSQPKTFISEVIPGEGMSPVVLNLRYSRVLTR